MGGEWQREKSPGGPRTGRKLQRFFHNTAAFREPQLHYLGDPLFCQEVAVKKAGPLAITRQPGNLDWKIRGFPSPAYAGFGFILLCMPNFKVKKLFTSVNGKRRIFNWANCRTAYCAGAFILQLLCESRFEIEWGSCPDRR